MPHAVFAETYLSTAATRDIIKQARIICQANLAQYHYHLSIEGYPPHNGQLFTTEKEAKAAVVKYTNQARRKGHHVEVIQERWGKRYNVDGKTISEIACKL